MSGGDGISGRQSGRLSAAAYFGCVALLTLAGVGVLSVALIPSIRRRKAQAAA